MERVKDIRRLEPRKRDGHKGDYGRVLIVGGSRGMVGAVGLAAGAAFRGGAGLVTFAAPETVQLTIAGLCPCATSLPLTCDEQGHLAAGSVRQVLKAVDTADVLAVGPGMAVGTVQQDIVRAALEQDKPLVLDADGLNNLCRINDWPAIRQCPLVLTPHPGEFARLTDCTTSDIQSDREKTALTAAERWTGGGESDLPLVCVLKGAGTVVTDGRRVYVNTTGNPGMACGGSGDVLTGLTAAVIGQGHSPFDAACLAVYCHGLAGDLATEEIGEPSLMADDLLDTLPEALRRVS